MSSNVSGLNLSNMSSDISILIMYIILTLVLVLLGKLSGKMLYSLYWYIDPASYTYTISKEICKSVLSTEQQCTKKTDDDINREALASAQDDGRSVGATIGFMIGCILAMIKAYHIYMKLN